MPKYTSNKKVRSGVPLGGIGAGKMEIMPDGSINFVSFQNNWSEPIIGGKSGIPGFHFGVFTRRKNKICARLLQTGRLNTFPAVKKIEYNGSFPFAHLKYIDKDIPLKIELLSSSSFIPKNKKDSSLPGAFFKFKFKNPTRSFVTASLLVIGRNTIGNWGLGRFNKVTKTRNQTHLSFKNGRKEPMKNDFSMGDVTISIAGRDTEISYLGEWNLQSQCFTFKDHELKLDAWNYFSATGKLPSINTGKVIEGESQELGGALASKFELAPGEEKEITVTYAWHFPFHTIGHIYSKWFNNSVDVAKYLFKEEKRLLGSTRKWHKKLTEGPLPKWFSDALCNNLYPLFSSTWLGKNSEFITYESPIICPLMGTIDVRFYGSVPVSLFFPELELNVMKQFASVQRKDGYMPHDLGRKRIDLPSDGTTYYRWKDLCSKFALLAYRDYLITKNTGFLKKIYPGIKKAMEWQFTQDRNKDFLPDNEGKDQTFDVWNFYSTNSYTSGIFLASLLASIKMAKLFNDKQAERKFEDWYKKGRKSFEQKLWNGRYFANYACNEKGCEDSCTLAQLNGQWYAHMLGLGYIADKKKIRTAIKSILKLNAGKSKFGLVNSVYSDGRINKRSLHSRNIFPGMGYAFASLCIYEGFKKQGLQITEKIWNNFVYNARTPWNQFDLAKEKTGKGIFGDSYMRNMVIWSVFLALAKKDARMRKLLKAIIG